jgi:hypothetical protein
MGKEVSISNSIILYAIWAKTVTVTYYPNGRGTVPETTYAVIYNEAMKNASGEYKIAAGHMIVVRAATSTDMPWNIPLYLRDLSLYSDDNVDTSLDKLLFTVNVSDEYKDILREYTHNYRWQYFYDGVWQDITSEDAFLDSEGQTGKMHFRLACDWIEYTAEFSIIDNLNENGVCSIITPRYFLESPSAKDLRHYIDDNINILEIIDFLGCEVFENIGISSCISTLKKEKQSQNANIIRIKNQTIDINKFNSIEELIENNNFEKPPLVSLDSAAVSADKI